MASSAIVILGSPRSGTSWLAKIFDSHPSILYRHEPDEVEEAHSGVPVAPQLAKWIRQRGLRVAAKRPYFRKTWRPAGMDLAWRGLATGLAVAKRVPGSAAIGLPDLVFPFAWKTVRAAVKLVNWDGSMIARTMPGTRSVFIVRHPCGQIASVMAGQRAKRFAAGDHEPADAPHFQAGRAWAVGLGADAASFDVLPDAARYAWAWRAFNEPAVQAMRDMRNARVVVYEDLCRDPLAVSKDLFGFAGLTWHAQTEAFLGQSTKHDRPAGYFDVFRSTGDVPDRWRQSMSLADQDAVLEVVRSSPLASNWTSLTGG